MKIVQGTEYASPILLHICQSVNDVSNEKRERGIGIISNIFKDMFQCEYSVAENFWTEKWMIIFIYLFILK